MSLLESGENYLEAILKLLKEKPDVHAIDVVNELGFSKPSVSIALKKLQNAGYITIDDFSHLHLTDAGEEIANKIYGRHLFLSDFLAKLGVPEEVAEADACKMEHDLSEETIEAFTKLYDDMK